MKVIIIGLGLIGNERLKALRRLQSNGTPLQIGVYDPYIDKDLVDTWSYPSIESVKKANPDWVIICTPHDVAAKLVTEVLTWDCKVLMEKPFGRSYREAESIYNSVPDINEKLFLGFNYRFFEPLGQLINDVARLEFGDIISINMKIGHGGSPDSRKSWKLYSNLGGVEVLSDLGIHLLDLLPFFCLENPKPLYGKSWRGFWRNNMDEEVHLILKDWDTIINLESSVVKWSNTFNIQINAIEGYGIINGRGGNYGPMTYTKGKRWGWVNGKTQKESEELISVSDCKNSFHDELDALFNNENKYLLPPCRAYEALETMKLYDQCLRVVE